MLLENHVLFACCAIISVSMLDSNPRSFLVFLLGVEWRQRVLYLLVCVSIQGASRQFA